MTREEGPEQNINLTFRTLIVEEGWGGMAQEVREKFMTVPCIIAEACRIKCLCKERACAQLWEMMLRWWLKSVHWLCQSKIFGELEWAFFWRMVRAAARWIWVGKWMERKKLEMACVELWANMSLRKVYILCILKAIVLNNCGLTQPQITPQKEFVILYLFLLVGDSSCQSLSECWLSISNPCLQLLRGLLRPCYLGAKAPCFPQS